MDCSCLRLSRLRRGVNRTPNAGECPTFSTMKRNKNSACPSGVYVNGPPISTLQEIHGRSAIKAASADSLATAIDAFMSRDCFTLLRQVTLQRPIVETANTPVNPTSQRVKKATGSSFVFSQKDFSVLR